MTAGRLIDDNEPDWEDKPGVPERSLNPLLDEVLEFYQCADLLHVAREVMWLSGVKEALGFIPFRLSYTTVRFLVILYEETSKKMKADAQRMEERSSEINSKMPSKIR